MDIWQNLKPKQKSILLSVRLTTYQVAFLESMAELHGVSKSKIIRVCVDDRIAKEVMNGRIEPE